MTNNSRLEWWAWLLVIIGALNWGLIGLFRFDLVEAIFGSFSGITRIIYILVGVAGAYILISSDKFKMRK